MKSWKKPFLVLLLASSCAYGYEGPSPLTNIKVSCSIGFDSVKGIYTYGYKLTNPLPNDGQISSIKITIGTNSQTDAALSSDGLTQCARYSEDASRRALQKAPGVPVGSAAPKYWSCNYAQIDKGSLGTFRWGAAKSAGLIKPGQSLDGYALTSYGIPGIQQIIVEPFIYVDALPESYEGNLKAMFALENKVKWTGQTIGPKAPPKVFDGDSFINYLIALVNQSRTQGWIDNDGITNSFLTKLKNVQAKLASRDSNTAKNVLGAFLNDVQAQNGKHLSSEGYALLYFNGKYLVDHL